MYRLINIDRMLVDVSLASCNTVASLKYFTLWKWYRRRNISSCLNVAVVINIYVDKIIPMPLKRIHNEYWDVGINLYFLWLPTDLFNHYLIAMFHICLDSFIPPSCLSAPLLLFTQFHIFWIISPGTKWPPFRKWSFQMNEQCCIFVNISLKCVPQDSIDNNPALL